MIELLFVNVFSQCTSIPFTTGGHDTSIYNSMLNSNVHCKYNQITFWQPAQVWHMVNTINT